MATVTAPPQQAPVRTRAVYTRVAALGLLLVALAPATVLLAGLIAGMSLGEELAFFGTLIVVPLIAALLVWRFGAWAKAIGIVVALGAAFMLFWMAFGLSYPGSVADFLPGVLLPVGVLLAVGGGVAGLVAHRRGRFEAAATVGERRLGGSAIVLVALALLASGALMLTNRTTADGAGAVEATIRDFAFVEATYTLPAGEPTTVVVRNNDAFTHTFTVPELGVDELVLPGNEVAVDVTAPAGTYTLYCKPHADMNEPDPAAAGMAATLIAE
jgi:plastocyanin